MRRRKPKGILISAAVGVLIAGAFALAGCGGGQQGADTSDATSAAPVESSAPAEASASVEPSSAQAETSAAPAITAVDYMVLVNKQHALPAGWEEMLQSHIVTMQNSEGGDVVVEQKAYDAYLALKADLEQEGVYIDLDSAYRTAADQQRIIDDFNEQYGEEYTRTHVALPGCSEHESGLALDLYLIIDGKEVDENEDMERYPEIWEKIHAKLAEHGFILRYLPGKEDITGYSPEVWHIRYIDDPVIAKEIMDSGITFEEYMGVAD